MFFHQAHNSVGNDIYNAFYYRNIEWKSHLHKSYEITFVLEGEIEVTLGGKIFTVTSGQNVLVFPYQLHSYHTKTSSLVLTIVFSGSFVQTFDRIYADKEALPCAFTLSNDTLNFVKAGLFTATSGNEDSTEIPRPPLFTVKACLYAVLSEFSCKVNLLDKKRNDVLIYDIISYVEKHFQKDITLKSMASDLGYDYRYLSRVFNETMGVGFKTFVNQYRCDMVKSLISDTTLSLSEIALSSGFQSIRSFNRVFRQITGTSPSDLLKGEKL